MLEALIFPFINVLMSGLGVRLSNPTAALMLND
jgi:hypothetical protein